MTSACSVLGAQCWFLLWSWHTGGWKKSYKDLLCLEYRFILNVIVLVKSVWYSEAVGSPHFNTFLPRLLHLFHNSRPLCFFVFCLTHHLSQWPKWRLVCICLKQHLHKLSKQTSPVQRCLNQHFVDSVTFCSTVWNSSDALITCQMNIRSWPFPNKQLRY